MNVLDALRAIYPTLPDDHVLEASPPAPPAGLYFVVSDLSDGEAGALYASASGHVPQRRVATVLVTLVGELGWSAAQLRPHWDAVRHRLPGLVTAHPGLPPPERVSRGACLPPTPDPPRGRPYAAVRLRIRYVE